MRPIARIVCWSCRQGDKQLFRLKDKYGFKTPDYVCVDCKPLVSLPPIANMSKIYFPTDEQLQALKEQQQQAAPSTPKVVPVEGDPVVVPSNGEDLPKVQ